MALLSSGVLVGVFASMMPTTSLADPKDKKDKVEIEGVVADKTGACPSITFTIAGKRIVTDQRTEFEDGSCDEVANGKKVEVEGAALQNGTIRATEVDFD